MRSSTRQPAGRRRAPQRRPGAPTRGACLASIGLAWVAACGTPDNFESRIELAEAVATAVVHREPQLVDLGTPEGRTHLGSGWSWNERKQGDSFVWATGGRSELSFFLSTTRSFEIEVRCFPFSYPGAPLQEIRPTLNQTSLEPVSLAPGPQIYRIPVPKGAAKEGVNRLAFEYAYSQAPREVLGEGDGRRLAVGWDWIRFHLQPAGTESPVTWTDREVSMPFGTGVDFYFEASIGDRLRIDEVQFSRPIDSRLSIALQTDGRERASLLELESDLEDIVINLPLEAGEAARLSLRNGAQDKNPGPAQLLRPRLESRTREREPAPAVVSSVTDLTSIDRPNILVYVVDTMRADHLGIYGYGRDVSPELDRFGSEAVVFDQAMAQTSWTKPAVASIFTGFRTTSHGVNHRRHRLASELLTLAEVLSAASYRTAAFTTNAYFSIDSGLRQGFDDFSFRPVRADRVNRQIFEWLDKRTDDEPFFLYVHTIDPHPPYDPPAEFRRKIAPQVSDPVAGSFEHIRGLASGEIQRTPKTDQDLVDLYDAEIAFADREFGHLLQSLRDRGIYDQTTVLFLSDHGEGFYEHGIQGHAWDLHRESLQVPLILKLPGSKRGRRVSEPVQHIDLLPTLLELSDIEVPAAVQGRSLVTLLTDDPRDPVAPTPIFSYLDYEGRTGMSLILGPWKLIEPLSTGFTPGRQLFHRLQDPTEQTNLATEYPVLAGYMATLVREQLLDLEKPPETEEFDEETEQQLRALGYLE